MSTNTPDPLTDVCAERYRELPGLWRDATGAMHFSIVEFHDAHRIPNTPEEIEETREMITAMLAKTQPGEPVTFRATRIPPPALS